MKQKVQPYQCEICEEWCSTFDILKEHEKLHVEHEKLEKQDNQCDVCSKSFSTSYYLDIHLKAVHLGYRPFTCEICDKKFARKSELENHIRIHTGERPYKCIQCHQSFKQRSNLETHVSTKHKGEKKFQCLECQMSFTRRRLLTYHMYAKHVKEKPLKCTYCDKGFIYPQLFKKHMLSCKSRPQVDLYILINPDGEKCLLNRVGENYHMVNTDEHLHLLDATLEQNNAAANQCDYQEGNKIIPDDCHQESKVLVQPSNDIQEIIDRSYLLEDKEIKSNDSALIEPNTLVQETIDMLLHEQNEMFELVFKDQDGLWYSYDCVKEKYIDIEETQYDSNSSI